ncbi:hypothetical protein N2152v2_010891 [Parachlorella kessleri]
MEDDDVQDDQRFSARMVSVKGLITALQAIKTTSRQYCTLTFQGSGMTVHWEDESKSLQSGVFLSSGLFAEYSAPRKSMLGLPFHLLLDTLTLFASSGAGELSLSYPGPNAELVLETQEDVGGGGSVCTYARIDSVEMPRPREMMDWWEDPSSYFLLQGSLLKEAIDDLEWTGGDVEISLKSDPPKLRLTSTRTGSLEIDFPFEQLSGMSCSEPEVRHTYRYKFLKTAFSHIPSPKEAANVATKVSMDSRGLMKVTHMLSLHSLGADRQEITHPLASLDSQHAAATASRVGVVQFMLLPKEDELEEDGHDD